MVRKYSVDNVKVEDLLAWINQGRVGLPEMQRPFVWSSAKVRDLIDSLYNGYPIGYIVTWLNPAAKLKNDSDSNNKEIIIDGQQRLTALKAALNGDEVIDKHYNREHIAISFKPSEEIFATKNVATEKDPRWIDDISIIFKPDYNSWKFVDESADRLGMEKPDLGVSLPFPILNDIFRGCKLGSTMAVGMLSNAGKSRFMTKIIAYLTLVKHERVFVMLNEMGVDDLRKCLITTCINNVEFQKLHGIKLKKPEKELTLGLYKDKSGEYIYQETDDWGESTETLQEYVQRVAENSEEYVKIMKIAEWIEAETNELILVKDMAGGYDDKTLEFEIRKANLTHGAKYFFYDTCKQDTQATGDWAALKATVTKLTDLAKQLNMFGYLSIQLTDDTEFCKPDELNSNNIANAKQLKHIIWTMTLFKEISVGDFHKYRYVQHDAEWGKDVECELKVGKRYYVGNVDKNRFGCKKKVVFEVDLDLNTWYEVGELRRK